MKPTVDVYRVMIDCPQSGAATPTGVELSDLMSFAFIALMPQAVVCIHCHERHVWTRRHAWLERRAASRVRVRAALTLRDPGAG
jgi:hypothetical protein